MNNLVIETCCGSVEDVIQSEYAGADRAELNLALSLGGLTPSVGMLREALEKTDKIRIMVMVRPRQGGFCYSEEDFNSMLKDAKLLLDAGAHGIVFGFLRDDGSVDGERCKRMLETAGEKEAVFHRAIDVVPDPFSAIDILANLGFTRVLTSGGAKSAPEGAQRIRKLREYAGGRIEIMPGAGIRPANASSVLDLTGCSSLHMSVRKTLKDMSVSGNPDIRFGSPFAPDEYSYEQIDGEELKKVIEKLRSERNSFR